MLIVKKFGGSSVANKERIFNVAKRCIEDYRAGHDVVVVLSAMGDTTDDYISLAKEITDTTDDLIALANTINPNAKKRELDMLLTTGEQVSVSLMAMAMQALDVPAVSLNAFQVMMHSTSRYGNARFKRVDTERIMHELDSRKIVIVTGFQGVNKYDDITTLGRGGSDTTAVALAAVLHADKCEIYTDVDGVYTADPRIVPEARKLKEITFSEMLELARLGAGVMQPRAVEYGEHNGVDIHVRSTFSQEPGTIIRREYTVEEKEFVIRGVTSDINVAKITVNGVPDVPGAAYRIFDALAKANITVDMIVQSSSKDNSRNDIVFTVTKSDLGDAIEALEKLKNEMGLEGVEVEANVAKVSVVGAGMLGNPGIAAGMFGALAKASVNLMIISTSEITISCLIAKDDVMKAVNAIHQHFFPPVED